MKTDDLKYDIKQHISSDKLKFTYTFNTSYADIIVMRTILK